MTKKTHIVKKGDTLWGIGQFYGVSVKQLADWNNIKGKKIHQLSIGQKIFLHLDESESYDTTLRIKLLDSAFKPINKATLQLEYDSKCENIAITKSITEDILIKDRHAGIKIYFLNIHKKFQLISHHTILPLGKKSLTLTSRMMKVSGSNLPEKGHQLEKLKDLSKVLEKENQQPRYNA